MFVQFGSKHNLLKTERSNYGLNMNVTFEDSVIKLNLCCQSFKANVLLPQKQEFIIGSHHLD